MAEDRIIIPPEEAAKDCARRVAERLASMTIDDYNMALEARLLEVRSDRGYTDRDPSEYYNSTVPRWAQDARDWVAFRDRVMLYGLQVLNEYRRTGTAPMSYDEFAAALAGMDCQWTFDETGA